MRQFDEKRLRELDEALRASARARGYVFEDTTAEGLLDEDKPQGLPPLDIPQGAHPALIALLDQRQAGLADAIAKLIRPEVRFIFGWATWKAYGEAIEVTWGDDVSLGVWMDDEFQELLRRYASP
jgi:hypothetical protein